MTKDSATAVLDATATGVCRKSPRPSALEFVRQFARTCMVLPGMSSESYFMAN